MSVASFAHPFFKEQEILGKGFRGNFRSCFCSLFEEKHHVQTPPERFRVLKWEVQSVLSMSEWLHLSGIKAPKSFGALASCIQLFECTLKRVVGHQLLVNWSQSCNYLLTPPKHRCKCFII